MRTVGASRGHLPDFCQLSQVLLHLCREKKKKEDLCDKSASKSSESSRAVVSNRRRSSGALDYFRCSTLDAHQGLSHKICHQ